VIQYLLKVRRQTSTIDMNVWALALELMGRLADAVCFATMHEPRVIPLSAHILHWRMISDCGKIAWAAVPYVRLARKARLLEGLLLYDGVSYLEHLSRRRR
jgi:hypothetical protein